MTDPRETSANWILDRVKAEGIRTGRPLTAQESGFLRRDMSDTVGTWPQADLIALNNKVVDLIRSAIEYEKAQGAETIKAWRGLRVPPDWMAHFNAVVSGNFPWTLSGPLQNAIHGNPMAGERKKWRSP